MSDPDRNDASDEATPRARTVLCIEDEIDLRTDIAEELSAAGYNVVQASNGREALDKLDEARPDLILCDITMPELNGYEFMARLRRDREDLAEVPIIFLTALADRTEMLNGKNSGADDYLVKPVDYDDLLATIRSRLRLVARVRRSLLHELERTQRHAIERAVREGEVTLAALAAALDRLSIGIFLLEESGEVRMTNEAARRLAAAADGLSLTPAGLVARSASTSRSVRAALGNALRDIGSTHTLALERSEGRPLVLQLSPSACPAATQDTPSLSPSTRTSRRTSRPRCWPPCSAVRRPRQGLAAALVAGKRLEEIGEEFGVKQTTITFHLQNLFQKTHTHRQADLIALLVRATIPLSLQG